MSENTDPANVYEYESDPSGLTDMQYQIECVKRLLRRYRLMEGEINVLTQRLRGVKRQEEELATNSDASMDGLPKAKGGYADPTSRTVERMIDVYQKKAAVLQRRIREMAAERAQADELMECLMPREYDIIRQRYVRMKSWTAIARDQFLCERQCQRISERGFKKMAQRMSEIMGPAIPEAETDSAD